MLFLSKKKLKRWSEATFFTTGAVVVTWGAAQRRGMELAILTALAFGSFILTNWTRQSRLPHWCQEPAFIYITWLLITLCVFAVSLTPMSLEICLGISAFTVISVNTLQRRKIEREAAEADEVRPVEAQRAKDQDDH
ncbi:hypothetical protein GCM10023334_053780 [Nonomuraea thailandensis]